VLVNAMKTRAALVLVALGFIVTAMLFVPRLGIEADEAIVGNGIYEHGAPLYSWHFGDSELPIMMISYLGALKTWIYNLLFWMVPPRPVSLRLPMVLIATATLGLFFKLLERTVGRIAAWIGTLLLATDSSYVLMNAADYGPVTLQFFLKLAALLLILRFHDRDSRAALAGGFFLLGLAMWDKAVFAWVLCGFALAVVIVFPRELKRSLTIRNVATAVVAMLVGALPLVIYNIAHPLETVRANAKVESAPVLAKTELLARTMDGSVLTGFMIAAQPGPDPGPARHWYQSFAIRLSEWTGHPRHNLTLWAAIVSVVALPFMWRTPARRPMLFAVLACIGTWLPMVLTAGAGAAAQHVILLWPFHFMAIAAVLAQIPVRWAAAAVTTVLCGSNLAVTDRYYADLVQNGPAIRWTDAMDPLNRTLADLHAPRIFVADWGIIETINLLSEGETPVSYAAESSATAMHNMLAAPGSVFVAHANGLAFLPQQRAALEQYAAQEGYTEESIAAIRDSNGRPAFDVFRFRNVHL
jgi:mannose/fructose/N-acetylgalactosamine-specific phosphotransferase system component IIC